MMVKITIDGQDYEFFHSKNMNHTVYIPTVIKGETFKLVHANLPNLSEDTRIVTYNMDGSVVDSNDSWFRLVKIEPKVKCLRWVVTKIPVYADGGLLFKTISSSEEYVELTDSQINDLIAQDF